MRIGIFFGGKSREREISFAGGRTVYDLLDKSVFTPIPIFVDSLGNFILLDWEYLYKGSIRDFYPPVKHLEKQDENFQIYIESLSDLNISKQEEIIAEVGKKISPENFKDYFDFAFLALHGPYGEDGSIQGILEYYNMPYSGSGVLPSAVGINKVVQKHFLKEMGIKAAESTSVKREHWMSGSENKLNFFNSVKSQFLLPVVIKSSSQGSSIGVSILKAWDFEQFENLINRSFFQQTVSKSEWIEKSPEQKRIFIQQLCDIYEGIGVPLQCIGLENQTPIIKLPAVVYQTLEKHFEDHSNALTLISLQTESEVLVEEFIRGKEFSCIVVEGENDEPIALPPTGIIKNDEIFNYRAKYLPGISRKVTPIDLPEPQIEQIINACEQLYQALKFDVYARIDGMITEEGVIYLNDPNTTSGMLPSSFFFHQAAEIGLSPSQFLSFIIYKSVAKRIEHTHHAFPLLDLQKKLHEKLLLNTESNTHKLRVGVVLGGISTERHISVESGRNVFEKLSSSGKYQVSPIFLTQEGEEISLFSLPMNLLLKDNADDISEKVKNYHSAPIIDKIITKAAFISHHFTSGNYEFKPKSIPIAELKNNFDFIFIGLHGRPGEDGTLQKSLEQLNIPYNGSGIDSSGITINKYLTNEILHSHGFLIPKHFLINKSEWLADASALYTNIESHLPYPIIAKPADDGCSSAVKKINSRAELDVFTKAMFRNEIELNNTLRDSLSLLGNEEFPKKDFFVVEELVAPEGAKHFIEITGGMLTSYDEEGAIKYELFEPSEALASKGILSLEEKFLAGEGQNITPARFSGQAEENKSISKIVRETLGAAAKVLNIEGYCRIDAFVRIFSKDKVEVIFIEVNSLPGLTPATCIFHQAALNGYKPFQFLDHIIQYGIEKENRRSPRS